MEIRYLTEDNRPAIELLIAEAFGQGQGPDPNLPLPTMPDNWLNTRRIGMFRDDKLVATTFTHPMIMNWDFGEIPMGGVACVTCTASERGQGHVDKLLRHALRDMRDSGQYFSGLHPFQYSFYKRFGYGWVGERHATTLPVNELKSSPYGRNVETYHGMDAKEIVEPIYDQYALRYRGMHLRKGSFPNWWYRSLVASPLARKDTTPYVHVYINPSTKIAEGYMIFRFETDREKAKIGDFVVLTPEARLGLLSILHYYGTQIKTVTLDLPTDDPLPLFIMNHELERIVKPLFMARIVDVKPALESLKPATEIHGSCVVSIEDPICDWNSSIFQITLEAGNVLMQKTTKAADVTLNIEQLTQAYWGLPSLTTLRDAGAIGVHNPSVFDTLAKLLPETKSFMSEFF